MAQIYDEIPEAEMVLALAPEELAFTLLQIARTHVNNNIFHPNSFIQPQPRPGTGQPAYPPQIEQEIQLALAEAWQWVESQALVVPAPGINGTNGFRMFSRRGREMTDRGDFDSYRKAAAFPKDLLHPAIADRVWTSLARGELDSAVFFAYRTVEEAVRIAGGFAETDVGVALMRQAFHPENGPLTDESQPEAEREALAHLFAGAIGSYKNPHSHRTVTISDSTEAQEMVLLASHLLRIVDDRRPEE